MWKYFPPFRFLNGIVVKINDEANSFVCKQAYYFTLPIAKTKKQKKCKIQNAYN